MLTGILADFVDLFVTVFTVLLIIRVVASYIADPAGRFYGGIVSMTEPLIEPIRKVMPQTPGLDLAPLVTYVLLRVAQYLIHMVLGV